jgi:23S rRNA (pseudouridine1915-N3)-methyltransferase
LLILLHIRQLKMKISLICIGKTKHQFVADGIEFYLKRISKYMRLQIHEIALPSKGIAGPPHMVVKKECEMIEAHLKGNEFVVLLDEKGHLFSSEKFSGYIQHLMNTIQQPIVFVVGGAYGFSEEFRKKASTSISLSEMTFPHQLVRVIFLEQMFRAFAIMKNDPYHHA